MRQIFDNSLDVRTGLITRRVDQRLLEDVGRERQSQALTKEEPDRACPEAFCLSSSFK